MAGTRTLSNITVLCTSDGIIRYLPPTVFVREERSRSITKPKTTRKRRQPRKYGPRRIIIIVLQYVRRNKKTRPVDVAGFPSRETEKTDHGLVM